MPSSEGLGDPYSWCSVPHWDAAGPQLTGKARNSSGLCRDICQPADTGGSRVPVITRPVMPSLSKHPTAGGRECGPGGQKAASWTGRRAIRTDYWGWGSCFASTVRWACSPSISQTGWNHVGLPHVQSQHSEAGGSRTSGFPERWARLLSEVEAPHTL